MIKILETERTGFAVRLQENEEEGRGGVTRMGLVPFTWVRWKIMEKI